jgi:hypothetical protein
MRARRVDGNQRAFVQGLRDAGCTVAVTSSLGEGFPDVTVGLRMRTFLFELKDPAKPPSARKLTPAEQKWHDGWRGHVAVVTTVEEALEIIARAFK